MLQTLVNYNSKNIYHNGPDLTNEIVDKKATSTCTDNCTLRRIILFLKLKLKFCFAFQTIEYYALRGSNDSL